MKCAVVYYSKTGVTKRIADQIQAKFNADVYLVEPEKAYGGFLSSVVRVVGEKISKKSRRSRLLFLILLLTMLCLSGSRYGAAQFPIFCRNTYARLI